MVFFCLIGKYVYVSASMAPNRIRALRRERGMTLEMLADQVGLSTGHVFRLENGERNLTVKYFAAFAHALRVEPRDLIDPVVDGDRALIEALRRADPAKKAAVALLLGIEADLIDPKRPVAARGKRTETRR